jgi:hypothetical protein
MHRLGVLDKVDFVEEDTLYRAVIPGTLSVTLKANRTELVAGLKDKFPKRVRR